MPQTVTVTGGTADEIIQASELEEGEVGILVQRGEGHYGLEPGDAVVKMAMNLGSPQYYFFRSGPPYWSRSDGDCHKVRRLRPGEKLVIERTG